MSNPPSPSTIAAARIPKITDLREQLEYGDGKLARCAAFIDDLRVFRRRYQYAGLRGIDLWDWKSPQHQHALRQMTADFLDGDGYGEVFWPSDPTAANFNSLQYSSERTFITHTMRQLIFRLNLQQHRNQKYKRKATHETIELDDEDELDSIREHHHASIEDSSVSPALESLRQTQARTSSTSINAYSNASRVTDREHNISDAQTSAMPIADKLTTSKRKSAEVDRDNEQRQSKVIRLKLGPSNLNPTLRPIAPMYKRTSPRTKRTAAPVNYADIIDLDQPFSSPRSATESTLGYDSYGRAGDRNREVTQRQVETDEDQTNRIIIDELPTPTENPLSASSDMLRRTTIDSNIDPNLEQISSTSSLVNSSSQENAIPPGRLGRTLISESPSQLDTQAQRELYRMFAMDSRAQRLPTNGNPEVEHTSSVSHATPVAPSSPPPVPPPINTHKPAELVIESVALDASRSKPIPSANAGFGVSINYRVVLSHTPIYRSECWEPKGHFIKKSLSELIDELPLEDKEGILGLRIHLTGPGAIAREKIERDQDSKNIGARKELMRVFNVCKRIHRNADTGGELVMDCVIEVLRENSEDVCLPEDDEESLF